MDVRYYQKTLPFAKDRENSINVQSFESRGTRNAWEGLRRSQILEVNFLIN
ncbi:hypothetical protein DYBT9275_02302 [Dyadobacter sp. CECT 9275]|uniref:Uncharacterized protein n=1 Tax=Dyadobacter helix TaxID=2822344 RepID=A0A916JBD0_9BACT|nr:hypothetical protein DYBT9275_02302 [Dyadobacter sp. CECT 9275]